MTEFKNVDGHYYPSVHGGWGGFAEELFHYTSRYYATTEAFLRNLADDSRFSMSGYQAARLSVVQRDLMAAVLSCRPELQTAVAVISIVDTVLRGDGGVDPEWVAVYRQRLQDLPTSDIAEQHIGAGDQPLSNIDPLDPFLSMAERLLMPVAVRERHVEVSMLALARHLDSPNSRVRSNLQQAVIAMHHAGYVLRNHPHLTHTEALEIGDEGSV